MKLLITGGAGILGSALVEKLSFRSDIESITVYDNLSAGNTDFFFHTKLNKSKVTFMEGDILETRKLVKLIKGMDTVVHLASLDVSSQDNASAHHMEQVNHWGTAELSYALENSSVKKVVFVSTTDVYGYSSEEKTETSEPAPVTAFAASKLRGEAHILRLSSRLNSVVLRTGTVAGLGNIKKIKGLANRFLIDAVTKNRLSIHGSGKQIRPIASLEYVVDCLEKSIQADFPSGIYNVVQANVQVLDLLEELKKLKPDLEFIFANHHLELPSVIVKTERGDQLSPATFNLGEVYASALGTLAI